MKSIKSIKKFFRFISIYGLSRTLIKIIGRYRIKFPGIYLEWPRKKYISVVGCGQFAFSTICYFLRRKKGNIFLSCYDVNPDNAKFLAKFYNFNKVANSFEEIIEDKRLKAIYIASNHHSHSEYAIEALKKNLDVHVEKPISVNKEQFIRLLEAASNSQAKIYAGYNRPFSPAICTIKKYIKDKNAPVTVNFFISGHSIPENHWYRDPKEGSRICGNLGHWLDLTVNLFAMRGNIPNKLDIGIIHSDINNPDENLTVTITSDMNDMATIVFSTRTEPFEGVSELINIQCDSVIAQINDFRYLTLWREEELIRKNFRPKDVGHERALMQVFGDYSRNWNEVELSTLLMLHITDMVNSRHTQSTIFLADELKKLKEMNLYKSVN